VEKLGELAPVRGIEAPLADSELLVHAKWPTERRLARRRRRPQIATMQQWCVAIRETRARYQVPPKDRLDRPLRGGPATRRRRAARGRRRCSGT
jgi:valyl-tRNA synthetase